MVVLIFRCPMKSFMISIGTPALTKNVAAKWRRGIKEAKVKAVKKAAKKATKKKAVKKKTMKKRAGENCLTYLQKKWGCSDGCFWDLWYYAMWCFTRRSLNGWEILDFELTLNFNPIYPRILASLCRAFEKRNHWKLNLKKDTWIPIKKHMIIFPGFLLTIERCELPTRSQLFLSANP